ncbi:N-acetylmuramoyl-L-alanine amidase [Popillia japonica]|uniref:Peptidoglycan-recognition protein n=1 Tax=Popillia japonica TaxID=7064 RepID=A0AAW1IZY6_POPJA
MLDGRAKTVVPSAMNIFGYVLTTMVCTCYGAIEINIVPRESWHARPAIEIKSMPNPVPYVIIHHSYIPPACHTTSECIEAMQFMQNLHMDERGWSDIGYSFAVGGDGNAYTGRGWSSVGAHTPLYNNQSIGICVIGDWRKDLPPQNQLETVHNLIQFGVDSNYIRSDYILYGPRQVRANTESPGERLFEEIKTWPHFSSDVQIFYNDTTK